jgi:ribonuclease-3
MSPRRLGLETRLGYRFEDRRLLARALTHRSFAHEQKAGEDYERLEFLGDSLLGFLVAEFLHAADPAADEGTLTLRKQRIVNMDSLAAAARRLDLGRDLRLGRGEEGSGGRGRASLLSDAFEAVLAAVYLDGGIRAARAFVRRHLREALSAPSGGRTGTGEDFKTLLQEAVQARLHRTPHYRIVRSSGLAHALVFEAEVLVGERVLGTGLGTSRKQAEQEAARAALGVLDFLEA